MSTRMTLRPAQVMTNVAMTADHQSSITILGSLTGVSYTVYWTGTSPVGTLAVEACNDCSVSAVGVPDSSTGHFVPLALVDDTGAVVTAIPVSGNTGKKFINVTGLQGGFVRLTYTYTSGTGTLNAYVQGKVQ